MAGNHDAPVIDPKRLALDLILATVLIGAPQLIGGAPAWANISITLACGLAALATAWLVRREELPRGRAWLLALPLMLAAFTLVQALPLPPSIVAILQPEALANAERSAALLGEEATRWMSLSLAPGATLEELLRGAAISAAFAMAWLWTGRGDRRRLLAIIYFSSLCMALCTLAHLAADADKLFGVYEPEWPTLLVAPLLNVNHLSAFLALGGPLGVGLGLDADKRGQASLYWLGAALCTATAVLTLSRGGIAGLVVGGVTFTLLTIVHRGARGSKGQTLARPSLAIATSLGTGLGLGLYLSADLVLRDFRNGDYTKLRLAREGLGLALTHPLLGVGRGAFSAAFVALEGSSERFVYPENVIAQWTSEWGFPIAALLLLTLLTQAMRVLRHPISWSRLGALAALLSLFVHEMVDFSLELTGMATVSAALLAGALAPGRGGRSRLSKHRKAKPESMRPGGAFGWVKRLSPLSLSPLSLTTCAGAAAIVAVGILGPGLQKRRPQNIQERLGSLLLGHERAAFRTELREALDLHPAEPAFPLLAGAEATAHSEAQAIPWLNRAMSMAPGWSAPHLQAAVFLARHGQVAQSMLELRQAVERGSSRATAQACLILQERPETLPLLFHAVGEDELGLRYLDHVVSCLPRDSVTLRMADEYLHSKGVDAASVRVAARELREGDTDAAALTLRPLERRHNTDLQVLRSRILVAQGRAVSARALLTRVALWTDRPEPVARAQTRVAATLGNFNEMRAIFELRRGRARGNASRISALRIEEGGLEAAQGNQGRARAAYLAAHRLDPDSSGLARAALLSERMNDLGAAFRAQTILCAAQGPQSSHCTEKERLRARLFESLPLPPQQP